MAAQAATGTKELEFKAAHKFARSTARKARLVADLVRSRNVNTALEILLFEHRRAAHMVEQLIHGAIHNANQFVSHALDLKKSNPQQYQEKFGEYGDALDKFDADELFVKGIWVNEGPKLKRWLPRAMGRATPILKKMCHIHVVLGYKIGEQNK